MEINGLEKQICNLKLYLSLEKFHEGGNYEL